MYADDAGAPPIPLEVLTLEFAGPPAPDPQARAAAAAALAALRTAGETGAPTVWGTAADFAAAAANATRTAAAGGWQAAVLADIRAFAAGWPASHVRKWASASPDGVWTLPPEGSQSAYYYPLICNDKTQAVVCVHGPC